MVRYFVFYMIIDGYMVSPCNKVVENTESNRRIQTGDDLERVREVLAEVSKTTPDNILICNIQRMPI